MTDPADLADQLDDLAVQVADALAEHQHPAHVREWLAEALTPLERARDYYAQRRDEGARRSTGARGRWYVPERTVDAYRALRGTPRSWDACERQLIDLSRDARYRSTDRQGREQWRTGRPHSLRMVVDPRPRPEGDLPVLLWAGQGRPPAWCWDPEPEDEPPRPGEWWWVDDLGRVCEAERIAPGRWLSGGVEHGGAPLRRLTEDELRKVRRR